MRILQHSLMFVLFVLGLSVYAISQVKVSDVKLEGLKGPVKTVVQTGKAVSGYAEWVLKDTTKYQTTYLFNKDGELTETIHEGGPNSTLVYSKVDGYKTFKSVELKAAANDGNRFTVVGSKGEIKPIEPGEKITDPDTRFEYKYVYETDSSGRVTIERQFQNNGRLFRKRTFKYDEAGLLTFETEEDSIARMTYKYKYDGKGNVIEVHKTRDIKGSGSNSKQRITYTEMKFDAMGNWTERKSTNYSETEGRPEYKIAPKKYTLVDVEYRTITYY